jgi:endonuclease/exonuclease/phosphatase family metal-dependent hydrolase
MGYLLRFNKFVFTLNIISVFLTIMAYALPFLAPKLFPFLSVLTLVLPLFLILNTLFLCYWLLQLKRQAILSAVILLLGIPFINKFYRFSPVNAVHEDKDFVVMSYNVRLFNLFKWLDKEDVSKEITSFINDKNPDIVCLQEFSNSGKVDLKAYPHKYVALFGDRIKSGHAIYSKFPIVGRGKITFPNSNNNAVFADIKKGIDTIRVYSIHLQSIKITKDVKGIDQNGIDQHKSEYIFRRISQAFRTQQQQAELIKNHKLQCHFPIVLCGDLNNSAFSYVYSSVKGSLKDTYEQAGSGFGQTYHFNNYLKLYPARIDYIFCDSKFTVKEFSSFPQFVNSDHYPISTRLMLE